MTIRHKRYWVGGFFHCNEKPFKLFECFTLELHFLSLQEAMSATFLVKTVTKRKWIVRIKNVFMRIVGNEVLDANCTVYYKQICTSDALD